MRRCADVKSLVSGVLERMETRAHRFRKNIVTGTAKKADQEFIDCVVVEVQVHWLS